MCLVYETRRWCILPGCDGLCGISRTHHNYPILWNRCSWNTDSIGFHLLRRKCQTRVKSIIYVKGVTKKDSHTFVFKLPLRKNETFKKNTKHERRTNFIFLFLYFSFYLRKNVNNNNTIAG